MRDCSPVKHSRRVGHVRARIAFAACLIAASCGSEVADPDGSEPAIIQEHEAEGARLTLALDRVTLTTVETASLRLEVESDEADAVEFPDSKDGFGKFAVIGDEPGGDRLLDDGRVVRQRNYVLQPFLAGEYEVPSLTAVLNGEEEISTDPIAVAVTSVLDDPQDSELRDISDPVDVPMPRWWWLAAAAAVIALVALAMWIRRRRAAASAPGPEPPHALALAALDALLAEGLPGPDGLKRFYLRLSDIVRRYIEDRFGLRAPEQTTEEFLAAMAAEPAIRSEHQRLLRGFLQQADLVKFAQLVPGQEEIDSAVGAARRFVQQTVPDELITPVERREQPSS